jgi:hypothetical protein
MPRSRRCSGLFIHRLGLLLLLGNVLDTLDAYKFPVWNGQGPQQPFTHASQIIDESVCHAERLPYNGNCYFRLGDRDNVCGGVRVSPRPAHSD